MNGMSTCPIGMFFNQGKKTVCLFVSRQIRKMRFFFRGDVMSEGRIAGKDMPADGTIEDVLSRPEYAVSGT